MVVDAILLYSPLSDHIAFAQVQILILLMLVLAMRWLAIGREVAAGLMLALAAMLKAFPLVLALYLIITRRWMWNIPMRSWSRSTYRRRIST